MAFDSERFSPAEAAKHRHSLRLGNLIAEFFNDPRPVYDFGCGDGYYLGLVAKDGPKRCLGFDGSLTIKTKRFPFIIHPMDVASPFTAGPAGNVMCVEVGEHIESSRLSGLIDNINRHCDHRLVLTWAVRGQGGTRHVSCRDEAEVLKMFEPLGFHYLRSQSEDWRAQAGQDLWWFKKSIYLFQR